MIDCKKSIVHHDALEILIEALNSNGMSLEKHMVENSIFICPDKVKKQMEEPIKDPSDRTTRLSCCGQFKIASALLKRQDERDLQAWNRNY